jgi:uncharacterized protein YerC
MKPKDEDKAVDYTADINIFYKILAGTSSNSSKFKNLLSDLLTPSETRMINRRWHVARLLNEGKSIREVAGIAKVGTDTVVRISKKLESSSGILQKAIKDSQNRWQAEVDKSQKVVKTKKVIVKKTINKWVFGTSDNSSPTT